MKFLELENEWSLSTSVPLHGISNSSNGQCFKVSSKIFNSSRSGILDLENCQIESFIFQLAIKFLELRNFYRSVEYSY